MNIIHTAEQAKFEAIAIIMQSVNRLLDRAEKLGVTVTITQSPLVPLAMGNTTATADVRLSHKSRSMSDAELIDAVNTVTAESASFAAQMLLDMKEKLTKVMPTEVDDAVLERMWNAYAAQAGGKTFDGKEFQFKTWSELGAERQACWRAAFLASRDIVEHNGFPGDDK